MLDFSELFYCNFLLTLKFILLNSRYRTLLLNYFLIIELISVLANILYCITYCNTCITIRTCIVLAVSLQYAALILFILAGNEDMLKISDEFEFLPDQTSDYGVSCLIMGKWCIHACKLIHF